ncbi:hypothetical protein SGPA1_20799 [Streptomyces misionensis JCM 4497]
MAGRTRGPAPCCTRRSPEAGRGCWRPPPAGVRRPAGGHADPSAARPAAFGAGAAVRRRPLHPHPCDRRDTYAPGRAGVCGSRPSRRATADADGCVRLRPGRRRRVAAGRHRDPGPQAAGQPRWSPCVRLGQEEAEHDEGHRDRRLAEPHVMDRCPAAWTYARRHGRPQRRHHRLLPALSRCRGPLGRRLPGPEPRPPRASDHPAQKTPARSIARQSRTVGTRPSQALLRPHHCRTRPRRPQTLEATDALDPSTRPPARHLPRPRRPRLRPHQQHLRTGHDQTKHASPAITHQLVSENLARRCPGTAGQSWDTSGRYRG